MRILLAAAIATGSLVGLPAPALATPVADDDAKYQACGRVFPDPLAFGPSPSAAPGESPYAKGNAACRAVDFIQYGEALSGLRYLEKKFPRFVQVFNLRTDFAKVLDLTRGEGQSAGLPTNTLTRAKSDLYLVRITDEQVPEAGKKKFLYTLSLHGIEKAGVEGGLRAAEDLATWAATKPKQPIMETLPSSLPAGEALRRSSVWFALNNPDGWRRGDTSLGGLFYQRYNGNGVDLNRDWPEKGFTYRPYTPASEPETASFGKVLKSISPTWTGGVDLHGMLIDRAFSFTLLGASQRPYGKNQRMLQFTQGAYRDAETRLAWNPLIKPNNAPESCVPPGTSLTVNDPRSGCDPTPRVYGVQYGSIWDTIAYTVTGAIGNWADSDIGLNADFIDNEMSLSHLANCGTGKCYLPSAEQLHVDGNKSLIYAMINFSLLPEDTRFRFTGRAAYLTQPARLRNAGRPAGPVSRLPVQDPLSTQLVKNPTADATYEFDVVGKAKGRSSGGVQAKVTFSNVQGVGPGAFMGVAIDRRDNKEAAPGGSPWVTVNSDFNQSPIYLQSGMQVDANDLLPGRYRLRVFGDGAALVSAQLTFTRGRAWPDPGQVAYDVSNLDFFRELAPFAGPGKLTAVPAAGVAAGTADLSPYDTVIAVDRTLRDPRAAKALRAFAQAGGNVVLTDDALTGLAKMGVIDEADIVQRNVYAGSVSFQKNAVDGSPATYADPLAKNANPAGSAEGPRRRKQTTEPVPTGFAIQDAAGNDKGTLPQYGVKAAAWSKAGGRTVGVIGDSNAGDVTFGEIPLGKGRIRILGSLLPFPTDAYDHTFGLNDYAITFTAYELTKNLLSHTRPRGAGQPTGPGPSPGTLPSTGLGGPWLAALLLVVVLALATRRVRPARR